MIIIHKMYYIVTFTKKARHIQQSETSPGSQEMSRDGVLFF